MGIYFCTHQMEFPVLVIPENFLTPKDILVPFQNTPAYLTMSSEAILSEVCSHVLQYKDKLRIWWLYTLYSITS